MSGSRSLTALTHLAPASAAGAAVERGQTALQRFAHRGTIRKGLHEQLTSVHVLCSKKGAPLNLARHGGCAPSKWPLTQCQGRASRVMLQPGC